MSRQQHRSSPPRALANAARAVPPAPEVVDRCDLQRFVRRDGRIVGASGSGKTLLHLLGGLDTPTTGTVTLMGESLATLSDAARGDLRTAPSALSTSSTICWRS